MLMMVASILGVAALWSTTTPVVFIPGQVEELAEPSTTGLETDRVALSSKETASGRIVTYLPQPLWLQPKVGMAVEIRARSLHHGAAAGKVLAVGHRLEPIPAALRSRNHLPVEMGLPVVVSRPCELAILPGEVVDVRLLQ